MIVVIQCASRKRVGAGALRTGRGSPLLFVADPLKAPPSENWIYAKPDDISDKGVSWRELLIRYNAKPENNPLGLSPAHELYENAVYRQLVERFGIANTYILSAGWGLINANFLTPVYDITFSAQAEGYKRRKHRDTYRDLCMLPVSSKEPIVFFGGKDYVQLFASLTKPIAAPKIIFYNSDICPSAPGCSLKRFETSTRTNWHYECAKALVVGEIKIAPD